jgi:lipopolysaccharide transport system permease protein
METVEKINTLAVAKEATGKEEQWTEVIRPRTGLLDLRIGELIRYKDLVMMFVRRDFVSYYKQTILGPIWFFLQPLLTTLTFFIIFGRVAKISTDGVPAPLFYLAGITIWNYFAETLNKTATVFKDNSQMFGKVYFPRLAMPVSIVISNLVRFGIQFFLFLLVWGYYLISSDKVQPNAFIALTPVLVFNMALIALGLGMIITAMTTKYKDLVFLLTFGVQLLMYATPVIYPVSNLSEDYRWIIELNPMTSIVETFRYAFLGRGEFSWGGLGYSFGFAIAIVLLGTIIFNKVEKSFTDTV